MELGLGSRETLLQGFVIPSFGLLVVSQSSGQRYLIILAVLQLFAASFTISWLKIHIEQMLDAEEWESMRDVRDYIEGEIMTTTNSISVFLFAVAFFLYLYSFWVYWMAGLEGRLLQALFFVQALLLVQAVSDAIYAYTSDIQMKREETGSSS